MDKLKNKPDSKYGWKSNFKELFWAFFRLILLLPLVVMFFAYDKYGLNIAIVAIIVSSIIVLSIFLYIHFKDKKKKKEDRSLYI